MAIHEIAIITYSQSPLRSIMPMLDSQDHIHILDEKCEDISLSNLKELWIDAYIDLFDPRLNDPQYLYQFFARIHQICEESTVPCKRILRNFFYHTSHPSLKKVFYLYHHFVCFFEEGYGVNPIYIPDLLGDCYRYHPYNQIKKSDLALLWNQKSLFRVIHENDIVHNLLQNTLSEDVVILQGMKVSLVDLFDKISQVFGKRTNVIDNAYELTVQDHLKGQTLSEINYNLESICIQQL